MEDDTDMLTALSETGEAYNYFVTSMNDYIRSTFNRSMRIVSCHYSLVI